MLENEKINSSENFQLQERSSESASHLVMSYSLWPYSWYWNAKEGSQELPGVTGKFGNGVKNEASQTLIKFCQENALVIVNTLFQQHKRRLYTWTSPNGQYWNQIDSLEPKMEKLYTVSKNKTGNCLWLRSWIPISNSDLNWRKCGKSLDHSGMM